MNRSIDGILKQNNLTLLDHFVQCGIEPTQRSFHHRTETLAVWLSNGYFGLSKAAKRKKSTLHTTQYYHASIHQPPFVIILKETPQIWWITLIKKGFQRGGQASCQGGGKLQLQSTSLGIGQNVGQYIQVLPQEVQKTTKITTKSSVVSNCGETETYLLKSTNKLFVCLYLAHFKILTELTLSFHLYQLIFSMKVFTNV